MQSCKVMLYPNTHHLHSCPSLQFSTGFLLVKTTPLLEEKWNICLQAEFAAISVPFQDVLCDPKRNRREHNRGRVSEIHLFKKRKPPSALS